MAGYRGHRIGGGRHPGALGKAALVTALDLSYHHCGNGDLAPDFATQSA